MLQLSCFFFISFLQSILCDSQPHFTQPVYSITVPETAATSPRPPPGFLTVECTSTLPLQEYSIHSPQQPFLPFDISTDTGELEVTQDLDFETQANFSFVVVCTDVLGRNSTATVEVELSSVNEFPPEVALVNTFPILVPETTSVGTVIISSAPGGLRMFTAVDRDMGEDGVLNYTLVSTPDDHFTLDPASGTLTLVREIDFETENFPSNFVTMGVEIAACDRNTPLLDCPQIDVILYLIAQDDNNPSFIQDLYAVGLVETASINSNVLTLECVDIDVGTGGVQSIELLEPAPEVEAVFHLGPVGMNGSVYSSTLTVAGPLDYDSLFQSYLFQVSCYDTLHSSTATVSISILPRNDEVPMFQNVTASGYEFSVSQTAPIGTLVGSVSASDNDVGSGSGTLVMYTISSTSFFVIDPVTGQITTNSSLANITAMSTLVLNVTASDGEFDESVYVQVTISPGNFHAPSFLQPNQTLYLNELTMVGEIVANFTCSDNDTGPGGDITYSLSSEDDLFIIGTATGEITVSGSLILPPCCEAVVEYGVVVHCEDLGTPSFSDQAMLTVRVFRDDSVPPSLIMNSTSVAVSEGAPNGMIITNISATDPDTAELDFEIVHQSVPGTFTIDNAGSQRSHLLLAGILDYEELTSHHLLVEVVERREVPGEAQRVRGEVSVNVLDENDNSPQFTHIPPPVSVSDATPPGLPILSIQCSDRDSGSNAELRYSLVPDDLFTIDPNNGTVSPNASLNLSHGTFTSSHQLEVHCMDRGIPPLSSTTNVSITVYKSDTQPPVLPGAISTNISEGAELGEELVTVRAFDEDSPGLLYHLDNESAPGVFAINETTGVVSLAELIDRETVAMYSFSVIVEEVRVAPGPTQSSSALVSVEVLDENDNSPEFTHIPPPVSVSDATPPDLPILSIQCSDRDSGSNAELRYCLVPDDLFTIDPNNGTVSPNASLNLSHGTFTSSLQLEVHCMDRGIPPLSSTTNVSITIYKSDTQPPVLPGAISTNISEGAEVGEELVTVRAFDEDSPGLLYHLDNESAPGVFAINETTGVVFLAEAIDRETVAMYSFSVIVEEVRVAPGPTHSSSALVTIEVLDENDNHPQFTDSQEETVNITDNVPLGTVLTALLCQDADSGLSAELDYTLHGPGEATGDFSINSSGRLTVAGTLRLPDFVLTRDTNVTISCTDMGDPPLSSLQNATVFVHIVKADLQPPVINNTELTVTVLESASLTEPFYTISAYDIDSPGISYSLETYGLAPIIILVGTPQLFLSVPLDRETTPTYLITLVATELRTGGGGGQSTRANLTVQVGDINDNAPEFLNMSDPVSVSDATPPGLPILSIRCSDRDSGSNAELQYSLVPDDLFAIDPNNGTVSPNVSLNLSHGTFTSSHQLEVHCMDRGFPPLSSTTNVSITIYKSDTQPPVLPGAISTNISEGAELGEELVTVQAFDEDSPGLLYHLDNESAPGVFAINETTGVVSLSELIDRETVAMYSFSVIVEEVRVAPGPAHSSSALVTVEVLDENDNRPLFVASPDHVTVSDLTANGTALTTVQCTDEDEGSNAEVEYSIIPTHSLFAVDRNGSILVAKPLVLPDFTLSASHTISLQCKDLGVPPLTSSETVSLNVTITKEDVEPPQVNQSSVALSLPEDSASGSVAATITAFDVDSPAVALTILNQTTPGTFSILPFSPFNHPDFPQLVLSGSLDREAISTHTITILATAVQTDPMTPAQNASLSITVEVEDVNDNAPACSTDEQPLIRAGFYHYTPLFTLSCADADLGLNQQLVYMLDNTSLPHLPDGQLTINHTSIEVGLEGGIAAGSYNVCVAVSDLGTPQLRSMVCVNVVVMEREEDDGVPVYLIVAPVAAVLLLLGLVMVGGLCCCYCCNFYRMGRRRKLLINSDVPAERQLQGVTIISQQKIPTSVSMASHTLVSVDEVDAADESVDEMTMSFRPSSALSISNKHLSELLDEQYTGHLSSPTNHISHSNSSSSNDDLSLQLELDPTVTTFKGADWLSTPTPSEHTPSPTERVFSDLVLESTVL